jgi:hypothetical protein
MFTQYKNREEEISSLPSPKFILLPKDDYSLAHVFSIIYLHTRWSQIK